MKKILAFVLLVVLGCLVAGLAFAGTDAIKAVIAAKNSGGAPPDVTAPEVSTAAIGTDGTTLILGMSETVTRSGGTFDVDCSTAGADLTCIYSSGSGSNSLVYTIGTPVNSGDTCNLDYNGAANGIEDAAGNDLAAITDGVVTNNSTQGAYEIEDLFSVDSSANYTKISDTQGSGSLVIGSGVCGVTENTGSRWFHEASLSSPNHYVQATVTVIAGGENAYLIARADGSTGATADAYYVYYEDGGWSLYRLNNGSAGYLDWIASASSGSRTLRMEVLGTGATVNIKIIENSTTIIDHDDTDAGRLTSGSYIGIGFKNDSGGNPTLDNLSGDNL